MLLIDGMGSVDDAAALARFVREDLGASVQEIVATHYFSDHMAAYRLFPGARIHAHPACRETFDREENRTAEEASFFVVPTVLVSEPLTLVWGRFTLQVFPNPGYTPCMLNVDIPELDLVHGGDTVVGDMVFLPYADQDLLALALERLLACARPKLVLSHGGPRTAQSIRNAQHYLRTLQLAPGLSFTPDEAAYHQRNLLVVRPPRSP